MTKSQNTKNEQQKDLCITSEQLTEQWKKGELTNGWYWVKGIKAEGIYAYTAEYLNNMYRPRNGERIIEQVPSYEQWQEKLEENAHLKELLKECRGLFNRSTIDGEEPNNGEFIMILTKIDEVLK